VDALRMHWMQPCEDEKFRDEWLEKILGGKMERIEEEKEKEKEKKGGVWAVRGFDLSLVSYHQSQSVIHLQVPL
jgi:hypothetical protein